MTSPVARISGPSTMSCSGNLGHGITATFTDTNPGSASSGKATPASRSERMLSPIMTRVASLASGTPVALEMNGIVRDARGFASSTTTSSPRTANWMLMSPRTPSP